MNLKDKLPVSYLLFTVRGRISRLTYWTASIFICTSFYVLFNALNFLISYSATLIIYPVLFLALIATATKRLHDLDRSGYLLWLVFLPVIGPLFLIYLLGFKKGKRQSNRYGTAPGSAPDYFRNADPELIPQLKSGERIVNDVTQLNAILVAQVETPQSIEELQNMIKHADKTYFYWRRKV